MLRPKPHGALAGNPSRRHPPGGPRRPPRPWGPPPLSTARAETAEARQLNTDRPQTRACRRIIHLGLRARLPRAVEIASAMPFDRGRQREVEDRLGAVLDTADRRHA